MNKQGCPPSPFTQHSTEVLDRTVRAGSKTKRHPIGKMLSLSPDEPFPYMQEILESTTKQKP